MRKRVVGIKWTEGEGLDQMRLLNDGIRSVAPQSVLDSFSPDRLAMLDKDIDQAYVSVIHQKKIDAYWAGRFAAAIGEYVTVTEELFRLCPGFCTNDLDRLKRASGRCWVVQIGFSDLADDLDLEVSEKWDGYFRVIDRHEEIFPNSNTPVRQPVAGELRALVWAKSGGQCWYCGVMTNPFENFHADHIHPVIDGGTNDIANLVPCCQRCNNEKHASALEVFRQRRGGCLFWFERQGESR